MRNPNNVQVIVEGNSAPSRIYKMTNIPEYDYEDYNLYDPKQFKKYIDDIERACRFSFEYNRWVYFLREYMNMNSCSIYQMVSNKETFKIKIHLHHEPLTLFDICMAVYNRRSSSKEDLAVDSVAKEVMYQHYMLRVGIIPLSETVHELVHNNFIFIPTNAVFGKYWEFVDLYKEWIDDQVKDTLSMIEEKSRNYNMNELKDLLSINAIYLDTSTSFDQVPLEDMQKSMRERINEI
jgi:hypothetical protein